MIIDACNIQMVRLNLRFCLALFGIIIQKPSLWEMLFRFQDCVNLFCIDGIGDTEKLDDGLIDQMNNIGGDEVWHNIFLR